MYFSYLVSNLKVAKLSCGCSFNFGWMYKISKLGLHSHSIFRIWPLTEAVYHVRVEYLSGAGDEGSGHGGLVQVSEQVPLVVFRQVEPLGQAAGQIHQGVHRLTPFQSLVGAV